MQHASCDVGRRRGFFRRLAFHFRPRDAQRADDREVHLVEVHFFCEHVQRPDVGRALSAIKYTPAWRSYGARGICSVWTAGPVRGTPSPSA